MHLVKTVRGRLLLAALLVEALMLALLIGNSVRLLYDSLSEQAQRHAEQLSPILNAALIAPLAQRDYATVRAILDESRGKNGIDRVFRRRCQESRCRKRSWFRFQYA